MGVGDHASWSAGQGNGGQREDLQDGLHKFDQSLRKADELAYPKGPVRSTCRWAVMLWTGLRVCFRIRRCCGMRVSGRRSGLMKAD